MVLLVCFFKLMYVFISHSFIDVSLCGYVCESTCVRLENNLWKLILSFHNESSGDETQAAWWQTPLPIDHHTGPIVFKVFESIFQVCMHACACVRVCVCSIRGLKPGMFDCLVTKSSTPLSVLFPLLCLSQTVASGRRHSTTLSPAAAWGVLFRDRHPSDDNESRAESAGSRTGVY